MCLYQEMYLSHSSDGLWLGCNCRSGIILAMHHILQQFIHLWAQGLTKEDEHPMGNSLPFTPGLAMSFKGKTLGQLEQVSTIWMKMPQLK